MNAMRIGEVSVVTPFRYTRLLFGLGIGVVLFGKTLDGPTLVGCALVVAPGSIICFAHSRKPDKIRSLVPRKSILPASTNPDW